MATRQLYISGTAGTFLIANNGLTVTSDVLNNPLNYMTDLYFHSSLSYLQIKAKAINSATLTFAQQDMGVVTWPDAGKGGHF